MILGYPTIRAIKCLLNEGLREMKAHFGEMYAVNAGRSILPERLLTATVLIALYSIRSERQ